MTGKGACVRVCVCMVMEVPGESSTWQTFCGPKIVYNKPVEEKLSLYDKCS